MNFSCILISESLEYTISEIFDFGGGRSYEEPHEEAGQSARIFDHVGDLMRRFDEVEAYFRL